MYRIERLGVLLDGIGLSPHLTGQWERPDLGGQDGQRADVVASEPLSDVRPARFQMKQPRRDRTPLPRCLLAHRRGDGGVVLLTEDAIQER
jgi:hypothetical protein